MGLDWKMNSEGYNLNREIKDKLEEVRKSISHLLGDVQDLEGRGLDLEKITHSLAEAVKNLYNASIGATKDSLDTLFQFLSDAMQSLRNVLKELQELESNEQFVEAFIRSIASNLAILYPVTKRIEELKDRKIRKEYVEAKKESIVEEPILLERRTKPRIELEVDIGMNTDNNFYTGLSENISEGGIFVATHFPLPIGTEVILNFSLPPTGHFVMAKGRVKWIREYNTLNEEQIPGMGIQFIELKEEDKKAIEEFIKLRSPMFYEEF